MKYLIRYCSLFFCFVLLLVAFSVPVSAEEIEVKPYTVYFQNTRLSFYGTLDPFNTEPEVFTYHNAYNYSSSINYDIEFYLSNPDGSYVLKSGSDYKITLPSQLVYIDLVARDGTYTKRIPPSRVTGYLLYSDDTLEYFTAKLIKASSTPTYDYVIEVSPTKNVKQIVYTPRIPITEPMGKLVDFYLTVTDSDPMFIDKVDKKEGLLNTIIQWLSSLKDGISNVFNSIVELPSKIWSFIENGLKSLFVPSETYITSYKDKWDTLLSSRFGAVYQVGDIITDFLSNLVNLDGSTNSITLPESTISFGDVDFTFGGYNVSIVPEGFEWLKVTIQTLTSGVATLLFLNGLSKRYDLLMGGE